MPVAPATGIWDCTTAIHDEEVPLLDLNSHELIALQWATCEILKSRRERGCSEGAVDAHLAHANVKLMDELRDVHGIQVPQS